MYEQKPRFPGAEPWWDFDEECRKANAELEQALDKPGADRATRHQGGANNCWVGSTYGARRQQASRPPLDAPLTAGL